MNAPLANAATGSAEQSLRGLIGAQPPGLPDWPELAQLRDKGRALLDQASLPTRRDEDWRYSSLDFLRQQPLLGTTQPPAVDLHRAIEPLLLAEHAGPRLVFVNGRFSLAASRLEGLPEGIELRTLSGEQGKPSQALRQALQAPEKSPRVFAALNSALTADGLLLRLPADCDCPLPIELLQISTAPAGHPQGTPVHQPRHLLLLEQGAQAQLIERHASLTPNSTAFSNTVIDIVLQANSRLTHQRLLQGGPAERLLCDLRVQQASNSRYRLISAALGGDWSRQEIDIWLSGSGARADLDGLLLAGDGQLADCHLRVHHEAPDCTSRETFKGILDGKGRVVFDGLVRVERDAQKTDAALTNDNLLLSRQAEVDTKPQLQILADDVKCSHGTTVGEPDPEMIFYLRSRGIGHTRALQLLCQGFASEVLQGFDSEPLRELALQLLAEHIGDLRDDKLHGATDR